MIITVSIRILEEAFALHPKPYIRDKDLMYYFQGQEQARYDAVSLALKKGWLHKIRRGLYGIDKKFLDSSIKLNLFELASAIYSPSYISLESALSFHGWIPERVYTTTSVTTARTKEFHTSFGVFSYGKTPSFNFYLQVSRYEAPGNAVYLLADPFKALADMLYLSKKNWKTLKDCSQDMRIEWDSFLDDKDTLELLAEHYPCKKTRYSLTKYLKELKEYESQVH